MFVPTIDESTLEKVQLIPYDPFLATNKYSSATLSLTPSNSVVLGVSFPDTKTLSIGRTVLVLSPITVVSESTSSVSTYAYVLYGYDPVLIADAVSSLYAVATLNYSPTSYVGEYDPDDWNFIKSNLSALSSGKASMTNSPDNQNYSEILVSSRFSVTSDFSAFMQRSIDLSAIVEASSSIEDSSVVVRKLSGVSYDQAALLTEEQLKEYVVDDVVVCSPMSNLKNKMYMEITNLLEEGVTDYVFVLSTNTASVAVGNDVVRTGSSSVSVANNIHVQPMMNQKDILKTLGGPYYGYVLNTYVSEYGRMPVPWFDVAEAKRIASRINQVNYFSDSDRIEVTYEYNDESQVFYVYYTDMNNSGVKFIMSRISPVRIGSKLLYPMMSYEVPWLLTKRPEPTYKDRTTTFDLDVDQIFGVSNVTASGESS